MASARTYDIPGDVTDIQQASRPEVPEAPIRLSSRCTKKNPRPRPGAFAVQNTLALTLLATLAALALSALTTLLVALATLTALPAALVLLSPLFILLATLLFVGVHTCSSNSLPVVTSSALK